MWIVDAVRTLGSCFCDFNEERKGMPFDCSSYSGSYIKFDVVYWLVRFQIFLATEPDEYVSGVRDDHNC